MEVDSHFMHYTTYITPIYKTIFFGERENNIQQYMLEATPWPTIRTLFLCDLAHTLQYEMKHWGTSDESS